MAKETLPTGPDSGKKENKLKLKWIDLVGALTQSKESKKAECDAKNEKLINDFYTSTHIDEFDEKYRDKINVSQLEHDPHCIKKYTTIECDNAADLKKYGALLIGEIYNYGSIRFIIGNEWNRSLDDLKYVLENLNMNYCTVYFQLPPNLLGHSEDSAKKFFRMLKECILKNNNCNGYFDLGAISTPTEKKRAKELITRLTKQGKKGIVNNYVIKINEKEYHSQGDYKYDFE